MGGYAVPCRRGERLVALTQGTKGFVSEGEEVVSSIPGRTEGMEMGWAWEHCESFALGRHEWVRREEFGDNQLGSS